MNLRFRQLFNFGIGDQALRDRFGLDAGTIESASIVGDLNNDVAAFVIGRKPDLSLLRFSRRTPLLGSLKSVICRVTHHVRKRIFDEIKHLTIELGLGALRFKLDFLAKLIGKIAHDARKLLPRVANRLHAGLHHAFLQFGSHAGQPLQWRLELGLLMAADDFEQLIAGEHQLGHHRHQLFEGVDCHTDRLVGALGGLVVFRCRLDSGRMLGSYRRLIR